MCWLSLGWPIHTDTCHGKILRFFQWISVAVVEEILPALRIFTDTVQIDEIESIVVNDSIALGIFCMQRPQQNISVDHGSLFGGVLISFCPD